MSSEPSSGSTSEDTTGTTTQRIEFDPLSEEQRDILDTLRSQSEAQVEALRSTTDFLDRSEGEFDFLTGNLEQDLQRAREELNAFRGPVQTAIKDQLDFLESGGDITPAQRELILKAQEASFDVGASDIRDEVDDLLERAGRFGLSRGLRGRETPGETGLVDQGVDTPVQDLISRITEQGVRQVGQLERGLSAQSFREQLLQPLRVQTVDNAIVGNILTENERRRQAAERLTGLAFNTRLGINQQQISGRLGATAAVNPNLAGLFGSLNTTRPSTTTGTTISNSRGTVPVSGGGFLETAGPILGGVGGFLEGASTVGLGV